MKLYYLRGLPASGKSSWAKDKIKELGSKNVVRVNKDLLREMVHFGEWSKENEKIILDIRDIIVELALSQGKDVIVDDTGFADIHLNKMMDIAVKYKADFNVIDFTHVPVDECIKRDQKRQNYVGEKVIKKMYNQYLAKPTPIIPKTLDRELPLAYIFDIDGTLAISKDRSPYDHTKYHEDIVNEAVRTLLNRVYSFCNGNVFIISGRSVEHRDITEKWLKDNEIEYKNLYMRAAGDKRNDDIIKRELYFGFIHGQYQVMGVFDDRLRVCRVWHSLNLPIFRVGDPDHDF